VIRTFRYHMRDVSRLCFLRYL